MIHSKKLKTPPFENLTGCFLAGGAILSDVTGVEINDYDIYPKDQSKLFDLIYYFMDDEEMELICETDRSISFKAKHLIGSDGRRKIVQIIKIKDFPTVEEIFNTFDFTVCMAAYDYDKKSYSFHESFYPDVSARRINFNVDTKYPYASLVRVKKYLDKGYKISKTESIKIGMSIARVGLPDSWKELSNAIGGIYGKAVEIGDNKEYTFDNAIEELSNVVVTEPIEDNTLHKQMTKIIKCKNPDMAYTIFRKDQNNIKSDLVKFGNNSYYIENGEVTDNIILSEHNEYVNKYGFSPLIPQSELKINCNLSDALKLKNVEMNVLDMDVYVLAIDREAIGMEKNSKTYRNEFTKIEFTLGIDIQSAILIFRNIGSAIGIKKEYEKLFEGEVDKIKMLKAKVSSTNVKYSYNKDILVATNVNIKGL